MTAALLESQRIFNAALAGVSDEQAARLPQSGGWTALGLVEHLVITESNLPRFFGTGTKQPDARRDPAREAQLELQIRNRESKVAAPERIHPTGKFTTVSEALSAFNSTRDATVQFVAEHEAELDTTMVTHPLFGAMSMRQLLVLAAGHSTRHAAQIEETLRSL